MEMSFRKDFSLLLRHYLLLSILLHIESAFLSPSSFMLTFTTSQPSFYLFCPRCLGAAKDGRPNPPAGRPGRRALGPCGRTPASHDDDNGHLSCPILHYQLHTSLRQHPEKIYWLR